MKQGSELLRHLANPSFAHRIMDAAQQGNQEQVDRLLRSIGIKAPITTRFSPTGIMISLHSREDQDPFKNCCSLTFSIKWGL
jgi:mannose/fructose/N-acetylgalactosamine-specific phosphotransferase system component IIC